ncbi:hypothetical protein PI124_g8413 [Phytophthora idaei]|nr:hypothetical protein PI124_g8413 [Phytophthora idaei]
MRRSYFLVMLLLAFTICVQGLTNKENAALSVNQRRQIAKGNMNLKGSSSTTEGVDIDHERRGLMTKVSEMLKGAVAPITKLFGKNAASNVQSLQKDTKLIDSIRSDPKFNQLKTVVSRNPGAVTEKNVGKIGEFVTKLKNI